MANSPYPVIIGTNGSNPSVMRALESGSGPSHPLQPPHYWNARIRWDDTGITWPAALTHTITLNTLFPNRAFISQVLRKHPYIHVAELFAGTGITSVTVTVGDAGDADGLLTSTAVHSSTGRFETSGAAQYSNRIEEAFEPTITFTAVGANLNLLTAGQLVVFIGYHPLPKVSAV